MRILFLAHNHPVIHPGGTEVFAARLRDALLRTCGAEVIFAATRTASKYTDNAGTHFGVLQPDDDTILLSGGDFRQDELSQGDTYGFLADVEKLAHHIRPDVVHFHHFLELGLEAVVSILHGCPGAKMVMTLHDYYAICSNEGLLVRKPSGQLCTNPNPMACHRCFPERSVESFRLRELFVRGAFSRIDRFIAPSNFLRQQFVAWGIDESRITFIPNGHPGKAAAPSDEHSESHEPVRFGFFGNLHRHKGIMVLLDAVRHLRRHSVSFELHIHGFDGYSPEVVKEALRAAAEDPDSGVVLHGPYDAQDASQLMTTVDWVVVPSLWPENNPLVIQEAFAAGRPVLAGDRGGMAEFVTPGENGATYRMGDAFELARAMQKIVDDRAAGLRWPRISPSVPSMEACANQHMALYRNLVEAREDSAVRKVRKQRIKNSRRAMATSDPALVPR